MYQRIRPWLFKLDPEYAHLATASAARLAQWLAPHALESTFSYGHPALGQHLLGLLFSNPIGLAAGFDKNAQLVRFFEGLGCGFVEVGSVTARATSGNPRPRLFRLPEDRALINRMGLNNHGAERISGRLRSVVNRLHVPLGVNLAKTHDSTVVAEAALQDYRVSFSQLAPLADYVTLNISCPNTPDGKSFEDGKTLDALLTIIDAQRKAQGLSVPILVKLPPLPTKATVFDSHLEEIIAVSLQHRVAGFVASNTSPDRKYLATSPARLARIGQGGVSGRPLLERSARLIRYLYRATDGRLPIIGVGGVDSVEGAVTLMSAGASLVQVYTGLIYEGPRLIRTLKEDLVRLMEKKKLSTVRQLVGVEVD